MGESALDVACPTCAAGVGKACRVEGRVGAYQGPHEARMYAWSKGLLERLDVLMKARVDVARAASTAEVFRTEVAIIVGVNPSLGENDIVEGVRRLRSKAEDDLVAMLRKRLDRFEERLDLLRDPAVVELLGGRGRGLDDQLRMARTVLGWMRDALAEQEPF